ncbi:glycoside hydrolase family 42 [Opitutaceae bacterium TAV5]|nr:glycoside hydrolase family 42 [Opitutaceae bacterium TAV5]
MVLFPYTRIFLPSYSPPRFSFLALSLALTATLSFSQIAAVQEVETHAKGTPDSGTPRSVNIAETHVLLDYDAASPDASPAPLQLSASGGARQEKTTPALARTDIARVNKITTKNWWLILTLPGTYPVEGTTLAFDYYVPESSALRSFTTNEKQPSIATRAIRKGRWVSEEIAFADMVGGDLWRLRDVRDIKNPTLTFSATRSGGIEIEIARITITRRATMPLPIPRVIRPARPDAQPVFAKEIEIANTDKNAWCQIMADGDFTLTINDREAGRGGYNHIDMERWPQGNRFLPLAREIPVGEYLVPGKNIIRVSVSSPHTAPELVFALGWQDNNERHVVISDATWATIPSPALDAATSTPCEDLGSLPSSDSRRFKSPVDIYPLLIPRPWDTRSYLSAPLDAFPQMEHTADVLRPRIIPGTWNIKKVGQRWSIIDPTGAPFFLLTTQTDYVHPRWAYRYSRHIYNTYKTEADWTAHDVDAIKRLGFNSLSVSFHEEHYKHAKTLGMSSFRFLGASGLASPKLRNKDGKTARMPDPFDPSWRSSFSEKLENQAAKWKDDSIIGVFVDNELSLDGALHNASVVGYVYSDAAGKQFVGWLRERYRTIDDLNRAWFGAAPDKKAARLSSFDDILVKKPAPVREKSKGLNHTQKSPTADTPAMDRDFYDFAMLVVQEYANYVLKEVRRIMPGKLVATNRFMGGATVEVLAAWKDYDIIGWNAYPMDRWDSGEYTQTQIDRMKLAWQVTGKPMIISEFGSQGLDSESSPSPTGKLATQKRRGEEYGKVLDQILRECPFVVGFALFSWMDSTEGERSNWGMVNPEGQPYRDYLDGIVHQHRKLNDMLPPLLATE